jgi:Haem-binding domain
MTWKWREPLLLVAALGTTQLAGPRLQNPTSPANYALEADQDVPPGIVKLLERSCMDCHSNQTRWAWYSRIAPVSWYIQNHVEKGREKMNFSEWSSRRDTAGKVIHSVNDLEAVCDSVSKGDMPFRSYTWVHPSAALSRDEKTAICDWTDKWAADRHASPPSGDTK